MGGRFLLCNSGIELQQSVQYLRAHFDFNDGKRVMVWQRGREESQALMVVVANFSNYGTPKPFNPSAEYIVPNFPATPPGKRWREITQERNVPQEWIGREPIFPWEAKVYALVD